MHSDCRKINSMCSIYNDNRWRKASKHHFNVSHSETFRHQYDTKCFIYLQQNNKVVIVLYYDRTKKASKSIIQPNNSADRQH